MKLTMATVQRQRQGQTQKQPGQQVQKEALRQIQSFETTKMVLHMSVCDQISMSEG